LSLSSGDTGEAGCAASFFTPHDGQNAASGDKKRPHPEHNGGASAARAAGWCWPGSFGRPLLAVVAVSVVVAADAWHVTPVVFLMLLAALTAIPEELGEAASLDGAGGLRRFAFITLPLLRPALLSAVLLRGLDALRVFATPLMLAGAEGLPVLSTYAYHQWSDYGNDGAAAAASSLLALLSVGLALPLVRRGTAP